MNVMRKVSICRKKIVMRHPENTQKERAGKRPKRQNEFGLIAMMYSKRYIHAFKAFCKMPIPLFSLGSL